MAILPLRFITTMSPCLSFTVLRLRYLSTPVFLASNTVCSITLLAVPPMWNVRMVSWVPGSPIDFPAVTPAARQIPPVALRADTAARLAREPGPDLALLDARLDHRLPLRLVNLLPQP